MSDTVRPNEPTVAGSEDLAKDDATDLAIQQLLRAVDLDDEPEPTAAPERAVQPALTPAPEPRAPRPSPVVAVAKEAPVNDPAPDPAPSCREQDFHEEQDPDDDFAETTPPRIVRWVKGFLARPDAPRLLAIAVLAIAFLAKPWFVVFLAVSAVVITVSVVAYIGFDRVAERVAIWHEGLSARDPERAEAIRLKAAQASRVASKLVSRLPEHWTEGLYLPDFEKAAPPSEKMKDDPFDKLARELGQAR